MNYFLLKFNVILINQLSKEILIRFYFYLICYLVFVRSILIQISVTCIEMLLRLLKRYDTIVWIPSYNHSNYILTLVVLSSKALWRVVSRTSRSTFPYFYKLCAFKHRSLLRSQNNLFNSRYVHGKQCLHLNVTGVRTLSGFGILYDQIKTEATRTNSESILLAGNRVHCNLMVYFTGI